MRQDIDIDQLMTETWLTVTMLKKGAITLNGSALYNACVKQVEGCGKRWSVPVMTMPVWNIFPTHNVPCWTKR